MKAIWLHVFLFLSAISHAQQLILFTWDDINAPPTRADVGPDATSISASAGITAGGANGTNGLNTNGASGTKLDLEMIIPGSPDFDVDGIDIAFYYNRDESAGTLLQRGTDFFVGQADALNVSYQVEQTDGTPVNVTITGPTFTVNGMQKVRFLYDPETGTGTIFLDDVQVGQNDGPDNLPLHWPAPAQDWRLGNQIDRSGRNGVVFDSLSVRAVSSGSALPVHLTAFTAAYDDDRRINLLWRTASERDNDYYSLERSADGVYWTAITRVDGGGTVATEREYRYTDHPPRDINEVYYRLRQVDIDGTATLSEVVSVHLSSQTGGVDVYPNPVTDQLTVRSQSAGSARLYTVNGELLPVPASRIGRPGIYSLDLSGIDPGLYFVRVGERVCRIVKE